MSWTQITVEVPDDLRDALIGEVAEIGISGAWEDASDRPGATRLVVYFEKSCDLDLAVSRIQSLFARLGLAEASILRSAVKDCDWTKEWKRSYTSFPIGENFFLSPSWLDDPCPGDRLPIRIDPGQAFGTGTHETTQLSIEALERWVEPNDVVLDVGTGSGILSIAARMLGARRVFACDIDEMAITVAEGNFLRNGVDSVSAFCGSVGAVQPDFVRLLLANLTADVITDFLPEFDRVLKVRGVVIFSGILSEQREDLLALLRQRRFLVHEEFSRGEWVTIAAEKHVA